jgi:hypothetical protein
LIDTSTDAISAFTTLDPDTKARLWRQQLQRFLDTDRELTGEQRSFITNLIPRLTPEFFVKDNGTRLCPEIKRAFPDRHVPIFASKNIGAIARLAMQPLFTRVLPRFDPFILCIAPMLMLVAAAVACYVPALRAARVDPSVALREL